MQTNVTAVFLVNNYLPQEEADELLSGRNLLHFKLKLTTVGNDVKPTHFPTKKIRKLNCQDTR